MASVATSIVLTILIAAFVVPNPTPAILAAQPADGTPTEAAAVSSMYAPLERCAVNSTSLPMVVKCSLTPSDDAFVDNLAPTRAYGDLPVLIIQDTPSIPKSRNYAYIKFDLPSTLPSNILESHAKPENATLQMFVRLTVAQSNASIGIYYVPQNNWTETSLTWDNRPSFDTGNFAVRDVTFNGTWFDWDVAEAAGSAMAQGGPLSLAVVPTSNAWRNYVWFDSKEYPVYRFLTWPTMSIAFVEPYLNFVAPFPHLPVTIDDRTFETDDNGRVGMYLAWGDHRIAVPDSIPKGEDVREGFVGWSDGSTNAIRTITIGNNLTLSVNYRTQYKLDVHSPYGSPGGAGWYFEDTIANATIQTNAVEGEGLLGFLGVRHVFDHWTGDCSGTQVTCSLKMTGPKSGIAVWRDDYTITWLLLGGVLAIAVTVSMLKRRKRRHAPRKRASRRPL